MAFADLTACIVLELIQRKLKSRNDFERGEKCSLMLKMFSHKLGVVIF